MNFIKVKKVLSKLGQPVVEENNPLGEKATAYAPCALGKCLKKLIFCTKKLDKEMILNKLLKNNSFIR